MDLFERPSTREPGHHPELFLNLLGLEPRYSLESRACHARCRTVSGSSASGVSACATAFVRASSRSIASVLRSSALLRATSSCLLHVKRSSPRRGLYCRAATAIRRSRCCFSRPRSDTCRAHLGGIQVRYAIAPMWARMPLGLGYVPSPRAPLC